MYDLVIFLTYFFVKKKSSVYEPFSKTWREENNWKTVEQYNLHLRTYKPNISSFTLIFSKCCGFIVANLSMMGVFYGPEI